MTDPKQLTAEEAIALRKRVEYEDQLLNSRTAIVLTLNGLMAVAVSLSLPLIAQILTAVIIIVVDAFWIVCSCDAQYYIYGLTVRINESEYTPIDEAIRIELQQGRFRIGSTRFMSVVIPSLLLAGWLLGLLTSIWNS